MTAELIKMRETKGGASAPAGADTVKVKAAGGGAKASGGCC